MSLENDFEGSLILEKLAEIDRRDEFFDAVDSDDFEKVKCLLREAQVNDQEISIVLNKIKSSEE